MDQLDHPMEAMIDDDTFQSGVYNDTRWVELDGSRSTPGSWSTGGLRHLGRLIRRHSLTPVRGVACDQRDLSFPRPQLAPPGRTYSHDDAACAFLERCDGVKTWGDLIRDLASDRAITADEARQSMQPTLNPSLRTVSCCFVTEPSLSSSLSRSAALRSAQSIPFCAPQPRTTIEIVYKERR